MERNNGQEIFRSSKVEIDLDAIVSNTETIRSVSGVDLYAVVKADAYGHGAVSVARALEQHKAIVGFVVSLPEEGIELRQAGIQHPILLIGTDFAQAHEQIIAHDIQPIIAQLDDLHCFINIAERSQKTICVHIEIDTGMTRLGIDVRDIDHVKAALQRQKHVVLEGLCTHLANADTDDPNDEQTITKRQLVKFDEIVTTWGALNHSLCIHAANSSALFRFKESRLSYVRPGIALYGNGTAASMLKQAFRFMTKVVLCRDIDAGEVVSYGGLWKAKHKSKIAVIPVGYADGYPRHLTNKASVLIQGKRYPIVGSVCMDMTMIDVSSADRDIDVGESVVLVGSQGDESISVAEFASWSGVTEYEATCCVSQRVPRTYRFQGKLIHE